MVTMVLSQLTRAGAEARCTYDRRSSLPSPKCLKVLATIGATFLLVSLVIYTIDPLELIIKNRLQMYNGSFLYNIWLAPPVDVYLKIYIFNITNPREFLEGKEKMNVEEIGPFVYREYLEHVNVSFHENGTMTYTPRRRVAFVPDRSQFEPRSTHVVVPNLALLGMASSLHSSNHIMRMGLSTLATFLDAKPMLRLSVYDFLWGYDDPLVRLASRFLPKWIHFPKIGVLDRMLDEGENIVTMRIENSKDDPTSAETELKKRAKRLFSIDQWNGSPGLKHWGFGKPGTGERECNTIQGASEGVIFPPALRPEMQFLVYRKPFCRTLPLRYMHSGSTPLPNKLPVFWYSLGEKAFDRVEENPENVCYCRPDVAPCLPKGLGDLTPCYYGIPAAVSKPHFLDSDPSLLLHVNGLHPNRTRHGTSIAIQPRLGVPLMANIRVQTNLVMHYTRGIPRTQKFNNMTLPIFWIDLTMEGLPAWMDSLLQLLLVIAPAVITALITTLSASGLALLMVAAAATLLRISSEKQRSFRPPTASVLSVASSAAAAAVGKMEPLLPRSPSPPLLHEGKSWH